MVSLAFILSLRDASFSSSCRSDEERVRQGEIRSRRPAAPSAVTDKLNKHHRCVLSCMCAAVHILTTVSKGSGLNLLLGLLVTEVTVAMGSWN